MKETSKCHQWRIKQGHFEKYLHGKGIDVGCGNDCLKPGWRDTLVTGWDRVDGDAMLLESQQDASYDFLYSSHCLEHLVDIPIALLNWTRVLKPGGFLYVVVPDYLLFEKLCWPSRYNGDHKHSFSLDVPRDAVQRQNHWLLDVNIYPILEKLGVTILEQGLQHEGFDWNRGADEQTMGKALSQIYFVGRKK